MTTKLFTELELSPEILKAVDKLGFEKASPIQSAAIPLIMEGRDVVGQSQTGSGKTAAFGIPIVERVDPARREIQALVLAPTRELAVQVSEEIHKLTLFKRGIHTLPIYGGQSYDRQFQGLRQGVQIVIGTPGRVMDHMRRGTLRLDKVKLVVLDEADVMLNMGFREDIDFILQAVPKERQTVFFSATLPRAIQELIQKHSRNPENVRIEQKAVTVPTVEQVYYEVDRRFKLELLTRLIDIHDYKLGIVFCNTKRMVDDLVDHLNAQGYSADRLHGDMSQGMRDRVMGKFRKSGLEFLVATDVAARGLDVDDVQVVFNYDLPYDPEDYVHRIGRTGRAGRSGRAISFVAGREVFQIYQIEKYTRVKIQRGKPPSVGEVEEARTAVFLEKVRTILKGSTHRGQEYLVERLLEEGHTSTDIAAALLHYLQQETSQPSRENVSAPSSRGREEFEERTPRARSFGSEREPARFRPDQRPSRPEGPRPRAASNEGFSSEKRPRQPVHRPSQERVTAAPSKPPSPAAEKILKNASALSKAREAAKPPAEVKVSRKTSEGHSRLFLNVGSEMGANREEIKNLILGATGLPQNVVGDIDVRERHVFVDVPAEHANGIISKLNRSQVRGKKIKVKLA